jgi:predicted secreted protein
VGRKITAYALMILPLLATACSAATPQDKVIEVNCDGFPASSGDQVTVSRSVAVEKGATIVLRLCANPSTGFSWEEADISAPSILAERSRVFIEPGPTMPGNAGLEQWTFEAIDDGECTVALNYSRPWEGGEKGAWRFELEVSVT